MRIIKFRGLNRNSKKWYYGSLLRTEQLGIQHAQIWLYEEGVPYPVDNETIGEWVNLKDKNGKEVYEGDIVKILQTDWPSKPDSDPRSLVEYLDSLTDLYVIDFDRAEFVALFQPGGYPHYLSWGEHGYCEVIGNIYENPELLEKAA